MISNIIRTKLEREYCKISTSSTQSLRKQMNKIHQTTKNQNQPQTQVTTITITKPTNNTIPHYPTYFLFTLTISTGHTSNVLPSRIFDKFVIFTKQGVETISVLFHH